MAKEKVIAPAGIITVDDIQAWYKANPWPLRPVDAIAPLQRSESDTWKTVQNAAYELNEAADPLSTGSRIAVAGREGYKKIQGGMSEFGKARQMTSKDLKEFNRLQIEFAKMQNTEAARQLINFYGDDLGFVRRAVQAQRTYLTYALLSNACSIGFLASNSPYFQGITTMDYPIDAWQKITVGTSWSDSAADILGDIQNAIDVAEAQGVTLTKMKINKKWFNYVRNNTGVQEQAASLVQNIFDTQNRPNLATVNRMLAEYFDQDIVFEVIDEKITRADVNDVKTTENPFKDGVVVFSVTTQVGRFVWTPVYIDDPTRELAESFFVVGNYKQIDPSYAKIYSKAEGFPVIDSYDDNIYMKVDAVDWP